VHQREAELQRALVAVEQLEQRTTAQVKAAIGKWNQANQLVQRTSGLTDTLKTSVAAIERLFEENQADLAKLLQARQRLITLENARLDSMWQATQAQADLLLAIGAPNLIAAAHSQAAAPASAPAMPAPASAPPPPAAAARTAEPGAQPRR
jgi:cobalt-zinc-cadmium efflux system outer membrane protein